MTIDVKEVLPRLFVELEKLRHQEVNVGEVLEALLAYLVNLRVWHETAGDNEALINDAHADLLDRLDAAHEAAQKALARQKQAAHVWPILSGILRDVLVKTVVKGG